MSTKPKALNRQGMYAVFTHEGRLLAYTLARTEKKSKEAFSGGPNLDPYNFWKSIGYFVHRVDAFITPVTTVKRLKP